MGCFADKGYYETTMDDIVRAANLSKGALYWHFKSKRELFRSLMNSWYEDFLRSMAEFVSQEGGPSEKLRMIMGALEHNAATQPELVRAQLEFYSFAVRDAEFSRWLREVYEESEELLSSLVSMGVETGEFRPMNPQATARLLLAYMDGVLLHQEMLSRDIGPAPTVGEMTETMLNLLREPSFGAVEQTHD